jgi:nitrite reductase/ring-hydroxylating ferredoxin subunit
MSASFPSNTDPKIRFGETICKTESLTHAGKAFRFQVQCAEIPSFPGMNADPEDFLPAFVIQYGNQYFAYLNRCSHIAMELDWNPGEVFDENQEWIVCATHYAVYEPTTGRCVSGPCPKGATLRSLPITVLNGQIYLGHL